MLGEKEVFGGWEFACVATVVPDRDTQGQPQRFDPASRYRDAATARMHRYGHGPFCRFALRGLPVDAGVYVLTADRAPVYVGECQNLAQRWGLSGYGSIQPRNCFSGGQQTNCRINNLILGAIEVGVSIDLWFHESDHRHAEEVTLMQLLRPPWNAQLTRKTVRSTEGT